MGKLPAVLTVVIIATGLSLSLSLINADQPTPNKPSAESKNEESIRIRYARAHLELAKVDLRRVTELNKKIPHVLTEGTIDEFRRHVEIDEEQLNQYLKGGKPDLHKICIRSAEAAVEVAEADLKRERALHERLRNTSSELEVERAVAVAKLAHLNLERVRSQEASESVLSHLQWQIEELRNEVLELRTKR